MENLINTIDKLVSEMSEAEHKLYTNFFLEVVNIGLAMELESVLDKEIEAIFCKAMGGKLLMTIEYKTNYRIKIKLGEYYGRREIDVIPYKVVDEKEVIGCTNDIAILPISEALRKLYPDRNRFTDKLLTLIPKSDPYNYHPSLYPYKSVFTDELLKLVPNPYFNQPKSYPYQYNLAHLFFTTNSKLNSNNNYNPLIMFVYRKQWANDIVKELNEVIALVKNEAEQGLK